MKGFILLMLLTASSITICAQTTKPIKSRKAASSHAKVTYSCTMHPEIISDSPGKCSKCGMTLVRKKSKAVVNDYNH